MIEILFYLSLAATLFLLFLLINHLKSRIVTLETQNEGLMDIIKLIRGNMVSSDNQQKNIHDRLVSLEQNPSPSLSFPSSATNRENITLEIKNVDMSNSVKKNKMEISNDEEDEYVLPVYDLQRSDDDEEDADDEDDEEEGDECLETIDIPYPTDVSGFIDIQKMNYDDDDEEEGDESGENNMNQIRELLQMQNIQGNGMSEIQKMMMLMSIGQGFPGFASFASSSSSSGFGDFANELEILEDEEEEDYTDLPELVEDDNENVSEEIPMTEIVEEVVSEIPVTEIVSEEIPVTEIVSEEIPVTEILSEEIPVTEIVSEEIPVTEIVSEEVIEHDVEEISESSEEQIDYHKLDVKTLRQMAQDLHIKENVKNLKKPEIIKLLSSQAKV